MRDAAGGSAEPITLDFAGMSSVIIQQAGSFLEWDNVVLRGFASKHLVNVSQYPYYRVHQLGGWPSYTAYPGAQVWGPLPTAATHPRTKRTRL